MGKPFQIHVTKDGARFQSNDVEISAADLVAFVCGNANGHLSVEFDKSGAYTLRMTEITLRGNPEPTGEHRPEYPLVDSSPPLVDGGLLTKHMLRAMPLEFPKLDKEQVTDGLAKLREKFGENNVELIEWKPEPMWIGGTTPSPPKPFKCRITLTSAVTGQHFSLGKVTAFGNTQLEAVQEALRLTEAITMFDR